MKFCALLLMSTSLALAAGPELEKARRLHESTEFNQSLKILQAVPQKDGAVYELIGRNYFMLAEYKKASEAFEKAVAAQPGDPLHNLWLGRAYGRRAETASPFTAPGLASKTRQQFEKAAQLDPRNLEILNDLLEYYLEAPGFLGGGVTKAEATAGQIAKIDPAAGHWAKAKVAEKRKQYDTAEDHLQRAVQAAPRQVGRLVDLARFLASRGRLEEAEQNFAKAEQLAPGDPKLLFDRADVYIKAHKNLDVARDLLKRYLNSKITADDPPRSEAEKLLRQAQGG